MTSKEIIKRIASVDRPPRIGLDFTAWSDMAYIHAAKYLPFKAHIIEEYSWGRHPALLKEVPDFRGEVRLDSFGNIYGRLDGITKGECVKGRLDDWGALIDFRMPDVDVAHFNDVKAFARARRDKYVVVHIPPVFSLLRDMRMIENALMDTILEKENINRLNGIICEFIDYLCGKVGGGSIDAVMVHDDWGAQEGALISEESFVSLFKPAYASIARSARKRGMDFILHSCGKIHSFLRHFAEAGVNVLQLDQQEIYPAQWLADNFADKAAFHCSLDIQRIMPTGDRGLIERGAKNLAETFWNMGCGFIAKDYHPWSDICVKEEWAEWARAVFFAFAGVGGR